MERVGRRSLEELIGLLERGYFVSGNQRITKEGVQDYRLWDDWENRDYHIGASSIMTLIEMEDIPIEDWFWHPGM